MRDPSLFEKNAFGEGEFALQERPGCLSGLLNSLPCKRSTAGCRRTLALGVVVWAQAVA